VMQRLQSEKTSGLADSRAQLCGLNCVSCPCSNPHFLRMGMGSSHCGSLEMNPTSIHEDACLILGLALWVKGSSIAMSIGYRLGLDVA